eukprot:441969_1
MLSSLRRISHQAHHTERCCKYCLSKPLTFRTFTTTSKLDSKDSNEFQLPDMNTYNEIIDEIRASGPNTGDNDLNEKAYKFISRCYEHPDNKNPSRSDLEYGISFLHNIINNNDDNNVRAIALLSKIKSAQQVQNQHILNEGMNEIMKYSSEWDLDSLIYFGVICAIDAGHLDKMMELAIEMKHKYGVKGLERRQEIENMLSQTGNENSFWRFQYYWNIMSLCLKYGLHYLPKSHDDIFGTKEMETKSMQLKLRDINVGNGEPNTAAYKNGVWERTLEKYGGKIDWYEVTGVDKVIKEDAICVLNGTLEKEKTCIGPWFDDRIVVMGKTEIDGTTEQEEWYLQRDDIDERLFVGSYRIGKVPSEGPSVDYMFDCKLQLK